MPTTHPFKPGTVYRGFCSVCKQAVWHSNHPQSAALPGMENADQERATESGLALAADLSAELRRPLADVSKKAGKMERHSPLFFGTGDQPSLF